MGVFFRMGSYVGLMASLCVLPGHRAPFMHICILIDSCIYIHSHMSIYFCVYRKDIEKFYEEESRCLYSLFTVTLYGCSSNRALLCVTSLW